MNHASMVAERIAFYRDSVSLSGLIVYMHEIRPSPAVYQSATCTLTAVWIAGRRFSTMVGGYVSQ